VTSRASRAKGRPFLSGEVTEWSKVHDWKSCVPARVPRVRIPPSPPLFLGRFAFPRLDPPCTFPAPSGAPTSGIASLSGASGPRPSRSTDSWDGRRLLHPLPRFTTLFPANPVAVKTYVSPFDLVQVQPLRVHENFTGDDGFPLSKVALPALSVTS
jgi:hypothetical protein